MNKIDTSLDGFKYVGIELTEEQFKDLCELNILIQSNEHRKNIPVFNTIIVLKILGLLPPEMITDISNNNTYDNTYKNIYDSLQRKFGRVE